MIPNPILRVLSTIRRNQVQALQMGGQACVFYGAAEFSRDTDLAVLAELDNLARLQAALDELRAVRIAVPPFEIGYLKRGHAVHFRCAHPDVHGLRVDMMAVMRGVAPFPELWSRRTTVTTEAGEEFDLMALPDLVQAKKTQRDKDWPMIRRLVEVSFLERPAAPTPEQISFWFRELRTPSLLRELAQRRPDALARHAPQRHVLAALERGGDDAALAAALIQEEEAERERDRAYWQPLKTELEQLRRNARSSGDAEAV